jgi:hypothetical protein
MKPNIFEIATRELTQDGFFTWLLQWADPSNKKYDEMLNKCAAEFVKLLIQKQMYIDFELTKIIAGRQWENIDIWAEINDKYLIIIEDKTFTGEHSEQLETYKITAAEWCKENKYEEPICIYLKTGSESKSSLDIISTKGYAVVSRNELISFFNQYKIKNDIFNDFIFKIQHLEKAENAFETKKLKDWDSNCWIGFFRFLESETDLQINSWNFVNNPSGGFYGLWWQGFAWKKYWLYLQIEEKKLCFKIGEVAKNHAKTRNEIYNIIMEKVQKRKKYEITKPQRFGNGIYMTVAVVKQEDWLGNENSIIKKDDVVVKLKEYEKFIKYCVK